MVLEGSLGEMGYSSESGVELEVDGNQLTMVTGFLGGGCSNSVRLVAFEPEAYILDA